VISRLKFFFAAFCLTLIIPVSGFATEPERQNGTLNQEPKEAKEDSLGIYDEENKVNDSYVLEDQLLRSQDTFKQDNNNSPSRTNTVVVKTEEPEDEDSNSAMSFNFIYYIIDKFKLADPLD
jgi:hypothetical protein